MKSKGLESKELFDLLKKDISSEFEVEFGENTPQHALLSFVAYLNCENVVKVLIDSKKVDINKENAYMYTHLHAAAALGNTMVVEILLKYEGIEINAQDLDGDTPLHIAVLYSHKGAVNILLKPTMD
ncbi:MAG: ankyrin repeat domain-containing protein [Wolbachia sp.]|nr:ankyrin repeat domain-containing protein [Wolbachia sp.]MDD9335891.1 ankyrin repeat domain-containing protein [Wolbachia sp.]